MDDEKLKNCEVVIEDFLFKLPKSSTSPTTVKMDSNIRSRRQSIRLQDKGVPSMRETTPKKSKKRPKTLKTGNVQKPIESSVVAANGTQNGPNQLELSDNEILEMLGDFATFIEDGVWNLKSDIFNIDEASATEAAQSAMSKPMTSAPATREHDYDYSVLQAITSQTQTLVEQKRSICTETEPPVLYSTTCQTDSVQRRSVATQTDFDQRSQSTQTCLDNQSSISVQTNFGDHSTASTNTDADSGRNALKRKSSSSSADPSKCQIFIKNYDLTNCSVNRGVFDYKIPKHSTNRDVDSGRPKSVHPKLPREKSSTDAPKLRKDLFPTEASQQLRPKSDFELMKMEVFSVLQRPCFKFLRRESCGLSCRSNHFLPPAADVAVAIQNWSNEQIHFLYLTYVQRYKMCHQMYFDVICNAFVERRSPENIIATIKDCERLALESQFIVVMFALKKCGYTDDDALFVICTHANRSRNAINEILKVIVTFKMANFKRTIAFLSSEMDTIDFDPYFGNEILKQAVEIETLDVISLNFCYGIVRKYSCILNAHYMKTLLLKM
ncbi:uncharacterized protein LOC119068083 [Bradysia coprophila]|uniref:uncharacterized protein LOC119068083 n=1 Tax=Bradysia coprophila TaxID=38358 RepID=UPI00187D9399|nr:uncharacterized protein LOC119068083 [Bradysia coprophila]